MNRASKEALERFDKAAQDYAFRGTFSDSRRYDEVVQEYEWAKAELMEQLR
jgi:hypothetical protein